MERGWGTSFVGKSCVDPVRGGMGVHPVQVLFRQVLSVWGE